MSIMSGVFLLFLAAAVAVYYLTPKKVRWLVLLAASAVFYLSASVKAGAYLLLTIAVTYAAARVLGALLERERAALAVPGAPAAQLRRRGLRRRRLVLAGALVLNFGTLAVLKYLDSWLASAQRLLGLTAPRLGLLLPLGISFYIFQTSGYLMDVYRGKIKPERNLLKYALFTAWFPQMVQGPINRYDKLAPQLFAGNDFDPDGVKYGLQLILWGMLKKMLIADKLAPGVNAVFADPTAYTGAITGLAAVLYSIQLYCDFSGGVDLVRGASRLFGVDMAENFNRPYFAVSIDDFWRRWHISLGEWMKDYLFYPLALSKPLNRLGKRLRGVFGRRAGQLFVPCVSTVLVFLAVGLWQGPGFGNIAYGLWNGGLMSLGMICAPACARLRAALRLRDDSKLLRIFRSLRTFALVAIGRCFSQAPTFRLGVWMLAHTVAAFGPKDPALLVSFGIGSVDWIVALTALAVVFAVSLAGERGVSVRAWLDRRHPVLQFAVVFLAVLIIVAGLSEGYVPISYVYENI